MPKFRVNPWLQLKSMGFHEIVTPWLLINNLEGKVTFDNLSPIRIKFSRHIQLHEKWHPNSIEKKYYFNRVCSIVRKYNLLYKSSIGRKDFKELHFFNPLKHDMP